VLDASIANGREAVAPLIGGGEMGRHVRATDWSATPLGAFETWPQSLRSSLSLVLNAKGIAALYWGPDQWLLYNDAYGAALGDRHPQAFGRPMPEALADIAPVLGPQVAAVLQTGEGFAIENLSMVMRRDGRDEETIWTYSFTPVQGEVGDFAGVLLLATEMTQQKAAERAKGLDKTRLETALRLARLGTFEWFPVTGVVDLDARGREIYDAPKTGEVYATDIFSRVAPEDFERVVARCTEIIERASHPNADPRGERISLDYDFLRLDGSRRAISSSGAVFQGEDGTWRMLGTIGDVTEVRRAEAQLREQNVTLEQRVEERTQERDRLWRNTQDIQVIIDRQGNFRAVNPAFTAILGWTTDEVVGRPLFEFLVPDDETVTVRALQHARVQSLPVVENRYHHKDGGFRWISWVAAPEGELIYASGRHITAEKGQAEALRQIEEALRQSQKMEAVGQLTGGLAHDFNNLLAGISGSLELMQTRMQQGRFNDVERYMAAAQGASRRAAALTHRLLAFSRRQTLDPKPTDVNRLVAGMEEMIQRAVGPGIPVEVVGAASLWLALVDPSQLENALLNLCINARDAMPDGGRITIETANKWLDEHAARKLDMPEGQYLSLCVTDTGTGMPPEVIARVFEPFFTTKPIGEGTGLGLSMIYGFAQQSGGQVRIYSEVGQGTTVCLYLPRHYGAIVDESGEAKRAELPRSEQGETVLVVDDEPTVRMLVSDILEDLGYTAIEAGDSAAGLKVLQSDVRIDLLVTDVGLPGGMNGRQMADAARVTRSDLRVLFITGYAENAVLGNGYLAPGMAVLTKPFTIEAMAARIRSMIEAGKEAERRQTN
jgi:PAS domain S-box-containing protein